MGTSVSVELIGWNDDGSSALLHRHTDRDGDTSDSYVVVAAGDRQPLADLQTSGVGYVDATHPRGETVARASCASALKRLAGALAANHFHGVTVRTDRCASARRTEAVARSVGAAHDVEASWVARPMQRPPSARERASWAVVDTAVPGAKYVYPVDANGVALDVASKSGKLILVFALTNSGSPERPKVVAFFQTQADYERLDVE